ncbi:gem-associated protein 5, partial [Nephila pilipes]
MSESLVLPFINRYYYQCASQSLSGIFAYGSRCDIFVIKALSNPVEMLDSKCIQLAHSSRVSCVSFCKDKDAELLASTGDNGDIKVWDLKNSNTCVNGGLVSGKTVEWVHGSSNILFYPLDSRHVAKWFLSSNLVRKIKTESDIPVSIMASNKNNLLALGHHNGTVTIIDIIQEKVLQKFKSHSQDICSLSWNPASQEMLLTTSMDLSIRSWKIGENKPVNSYHAPVGRVRFDDKKKVYIAGIWHPSYQDMVICSNFRGDVGEVCLSKDEIPKFSSYGLDVNAKGTLNFLTYTKKTEQGMQDLLIIFDFYKLSVWNISEKKLELKTPLVLGFIYGLSISSLNPNLLAISGSDGLLRIFNDQIDSVERNTSVYLHYKTKIMTVSWHPIYENIIAYGTDEGRVGIIDIFKKKSLYTFETYHTDKTYTVCWGPFKHLEGSKENEYFVYSCGSNSIFINRLNHSKEQALDFDDFAKVPDLMDSTKKSYTELNWNSNFSHVLTASCKGFIDLFNDHFIFLTRFSVEMRSIEYLTWHPERTYASPEGSSLKFWFAASGSDTVLHLFNAAKTLVEPFQEEQDSKWESKKLVGHKKRIGALCWSQHNDGHLASASRDGSVLVWNVCTGTILASYLHHKDSVLTVQWSVNDHDMIYSGSEDGTVRMWKISEHANIKPPEKVPPRRKGNRAPKKVCKGFRNYSEKKEVNSLVDENCESLKNKSLIDEKENDFTDLNDDEALLSSKIGDTAAESSPVSDKGYLGEREVKRLRTLYPCRSTIPLFPFHSLISSATNEVELEDCLQLADVLREKTFTPSGETQISDSLKNSKCTLTNEDILKLGPFTDQMTALKMMEIQAEKFRIEGNCRNSCLLSVMIGNVKDFIERDAINKNLSSFHVSLAPSVSHSFWLETCEKFANQLLEEHQYRQACTYFLMCNKVYEAVSVIAEKVDVMEALTLARARLPDSDPMIKRLLFQARKRYIAHNNQARVAKCLLALNQPLTAAKTLFFVSNPKFMDAAIYIARLYKLDNDIKKYVYLYMMKCLSLDDWNALAVLVNEEPSMKVYSSLIAVHKAFKTHLQYHRMKNKGLVKKSFSQRDSCKPVKFWIGSICMETKDSFINYVYHILLSNNLLPAKTEEMFDILKALEKMFIRKEAYDCVVQADIMISLCITQYIFYCILEDYTAANFYFLKIFEFSYHESFFLKAVCCLFIPINLSWNYDTHSIICESETDNSEENDTGTVLSHFHNINRAIAEEIMSFKSDYITSKFYSKDSYLLPTLGENLDVLKRKRINEYVLAYFVANITNDLMKLVDEREIMCFAEKLRSPELQKEDIESSFLSEKSENNIFIQTSTTCDVDIEEKSTQEEITTEEEELRNLIKDVLKDADEKVKFLLNTSKSAVDNDILQENIIPEETSLCIVPQKESFADFNEEKLKPPSEERHEKELAIASNDESFADFNEEKLKLLNE